MGVIVQPLGAALGAVGIFFVALFIKAVALWIFRGSKEDLISAAPRAGRLAHATLRSFLLPCVTYMMPMSKPQIKIENVRAAGGAVDFDATVAGYPVMLRMPDEFV